MLNKPVNDKTKIPKLVNFTPKLCAINLKYYNKSYRNKINKSYF